MNRFLCIGGLSGFIAVLAGAFGAHALKSHLTPEMLDVWQTGAHYHLVHSVVLIVVAVLLDRKSLKSLRVAGWLFTFGIIVFAGSLYALAISGVKILGAITPLGGLALLSGWIALLVAGLKNENQPDQA